MKRMNLPQLVNAIKENGGVSYSLIFGDLSGKEGFALSVHKERKKIIPLFTLTNEHIRQFAMSNSDLLADSRYFIGAWVENDQVFLDVSTLILSKETAINLAKENNQLSVYSFKNSSVFYVQ